MGHFTSADLVQVRIYLLPRDAGMTSTC
jgi:hypothetical protein